MALDTTRVADTAVPRAILVLGMHRSGTSALAGALGACGVELGDRLIDAAADNPQGYFENVDAVLADESLLDALDRAWDDVRAMPADWLGSQAAADAALAIRERVLPAFAGAATWAIKDPRMCRVLPLWTRELAAAGVHAAGLLVMRHPDEVADSLGARDGMHPYAARLLWLRHVLEAARSAPADSTCLRYGDLLRDPAGVLSTAMRALGLDIPLDPARLRGVLHDQARHHRHDARTAADPWQALCLDAYEALVGDGWRSALPGLVERMAALESESAAWIEAVGMAAREADRRRRRASTEARQAHARAELLQGALDSANALAEAHVQDVARLDRALRDTSEGLRKAEELAHAHTLEARRIADELQLTQQARSAAEALLRQATDEVAALSVQVRRTSDALGRAEALSAERLAEVQRLTAQLSDTEAGLREAERLATAHARDAARSDAALAEAQALVDAHGAEARALAAELERTQRALAQAEALVAARDVQLGELGERLALTEAGLAAADALVAARDVQLGELGERLALTEAGLAAADALVAARDVQLGELAERLGLTEAGLAAAEGLAVGRLAEIERWSQLRDAEHVARVDAEARAAALDQRVAELAGCLASTELERARLEAAIMRITASRLWPAFARTARLPRDIADG